jgi:hypothetical protein
LRRRQALPRLAWGVALALSASLHAEACGDLVLVSRLRPEMPAFTQNSGIDERKQFILRNAEQWAAAWRLIHGRSRPIPPEPVVEFVWEMVVVAALGRQRSGGFTIRVDRAYLEGSTTVIIVREEAPAEGCIVADAVTSPLDIAILPLLPEPIEFRFEYESRTCS